MPSYTSYTMLIFGASAFITGVHTLVRPESFLTTFSLPAGAEPSAHGNAVAAIAMGLYYTLSAVQDNRAFFVLSVPIRLFSAAIFGINGGSWHVAGLWEGTGALATGIALLFDNVWTAEKAKRTD